MKQVSKQSRRDWLRLRTLLARDTPWGAAASILDEVETQWLQESLHDL